MPVGFTFLFSFPFNKIKLKKEKKKSVTFVLSKVLLVWETKARAASLLSSELEPLVYCPFSITPHVDSTAEAGMHCMGKQPTLLQF